MQIQDKKIRPWEFIRSGNQSRQNSMLAHKSRRQGFLIERNVDLPSPARAYSCIFRGLLLFLLVYTPITMMNNAYEISNHIAIVPLILFPFAILVGFFNYNGLCRTVGYILFFLFFVVISTSGYYYINSGLNAIINITFETASYELNTSAIRTYNEVIGDRAVTIPLFYLYIGIVSVIFLNFLINNFMGTIVVLMVSAPFWMLTFYFDYTPAPIHYLSYAFCMMSMVILKSTQQYNLPDRLRKYNVIKHSNDRHLYRSTSNGVVMAQTSGFVVGILLFMVVLSNLIYPQNRFSTPSEWAAMKESTEDYARIFFTEGLGGFFKGSTLGSMTSYGNLYRSGKVSPTFQTVLEVDYVPASYEPVYIRQYIGDFYTGETWSDYIDADMSIIEKYEYQAHNTLKQIYEDSEHPLHDSVYKATIHVHPMNERGALVPYYSIEDYRSHPTLEYKIRTRQKSEKRDAFDYLVHYAPEFDHFTNAEHQKKQYTYEYYQLLPSAGSMSDVERYRAFDYTPEVSDQPELQPLGMDLDQYIIISDKSYLKRMRTISEVDPNQPKLYLALKSICEEQGFHGSVLDRVEQLQEFFSGYTYTLNPGNLPRNEDFILYFLTKNKHGFCQHFASSAVMLLRSMNIPARYVEGYMFSFSDVSSNSEIQNDIDASTMHEGPSQFNDAPVVKVPVSDASGHAWVEIWFPELGWVPFEFTVGINGDQDDESEYEFWNGGSFLDDIDFSPVTGLLQVDLTFATKLLTRFLLIIGVGVAILAIIRFILICLRENKKPEYFHSGKNLSIIERYRGICRKYSFFGLLSKDDLLYGDFTREMQEKHAFSEEKAGSLKKFLEDAAYGPDEISDDRYNETTVLLTDAKQKLESKLSFRQKLRYRLLSITRRKKA
ncbi:MAG: transglutaminase domain-containing protein [Lachnospiraceae bacterium]|nr:transglutaminase domain-containing protein [Lachnospiraceae bacterium]